MAAPQAPMPLRAQVAASDIGHGVTKTVTIVLPLEEFGPPPLLQPHGGYYNVGEPNATYTFNVPEKGIHGGRLRDICEACEAAVNEGAATVS